MLIRRPKCNGLSPCSTCLRRSLCCSYGPADVAVESPDAPPPAKRQSMMDRRPTAEALQESQPRSATADHGSSKSPMEPPGVTPPLLVDVAEKASDPFSRASRDELNHDEVAVVYTSARMLEDPTGRLCKSLGRRRLLPRCFAMRKFICSCGAALAYYD